MAGTRSLEKPRRIRPPEASEPLEAARRRQLLKAAEAVLLAKGYHAATMNDVAKAACMSKKTVYTLIESKAELFEALLARYQAMLAFPEPAPGATLRELLIADLLCLARFVLSPGQIGIMRLIMAEYTHSPDFGRAYIRACVNKAKGRLESRLAETQHGQAGNPREMAALLCGIAIGEFHLGMLIGFHPAPSKSTLDKRVHQAVDMVLAMGVEKQARQGGLCPPCPSTNGRAVRST